VERAEPGVLAPLALERDLPADHLGEGDAVTQFLDELRGNGHASAYRRMAAALL